MVTKVLVEAQLVTHGAIKELKKRGENSKKWVLVGGAIGHYAFEEVLVS